MEAGRARIGIVLALVAGLVFSANDALVKALLADVPVGDVLLLRCVPVLLVVAPLIVRALRQRRLVAPSVPLVLGVLVLAALDIACHYTALRTLQLADLAVFYMASPIIVTLLSALLLGERVDRRQAAAIALGFAGVLIALKPSPELFRPESLIGLAGSLAFSLMLVLTRMMRQLPPVLLVGCQMLGGMAFGALLSRWEFSALGVSVVAAIVGVGLMAALGLLCLNAALRFAPAAVVGPFQYVSILWAALFGFLVFGDVPSAATAVGGVAVVASGLLILTRTAPRRRAEGGMPP